MAEFIGRGRKARRTYGFDEISLVPGDVTINPNEVDISWEVGGYRFSVPIMAAAMDGVVNTAFAKQFGRMGGLAVLNLDGVQTRYEDLDPIFNKIAEATTDEATRIVQHLYEQPIKEELVIKRIRDIEDAGVCCAVSTIPQRAEQFGKLAADAGASFFVVQSTVATVRHIASEYKTLDFHKFIRNMPIPVIVGNTVTYSVTLELMEAGPAAILVGVGPGASCTSRAVLGLGVPQVTGIVDAAAARDFFFKRTGKRIPVVADGGMQGGGDVCKAIACGADAVMLGSLLARADEAPGRGYHWGMATPSHNLPRGTRIKVGTTGSLEKLIFGPASLDDGTQNIVGALRASMGNVGARSIKAMQLADLVIAPSIRTEGKVHQRAQSVGMGK